MIQKANEKGILDSTLDHLVPDDEHDVVTSGFGSFGSSNYVTAGRAADGALAMAYIPSTGTGTRAITVDMSQLAGQVQGRWYNPTNGTYTDVPGLPFANTGNRTFTTPGNNGTGANDWALVLEMPEPGRVALLGAGIALLCVLRRRPRVRRVR
jgi:hypothetical protein